MGRASLEAGPRIKDISEAGAMSSDRVAACEDIIDQIIQGKYASIPPGTCPLSRKLEALAHHLEQNARGELVRDVDISVNINTAVTKNSTMIQYLSEVDHRSHAIASAVEEMVASMQEIARTSDLAAADAQSTQETAHEGQQAAEQAVSAMESISQAVEEAASKVERLAQASGQIGEIVNQIEAIARQTNLLALNATIEAARAGEAGKGFAVVAHEVKNLANQTARATETIRERITNLREEMSSIVYSMEGGARAVSDGQTVIISAGESLRNVAEQSTRVTQGMMSVASILSQQNAATSEISSGVAVVADMSSRNVNVIKDVADSMDITCKIIAGSLNELMKQEITDATIHVAKSDHVIWCKRLADMLAGREKLKAEEMANHTNCRLGKWCAQVSDPTIRNHPAFSEMEAPHRAVHSNGIEAIKKYNAGDLVGAVASIALMTEASKGVLSALDRLSTRGKF